MIMSKRINTRICNKHDLEVNWLRTEDFIPLQGELIIYDREIDSAGNILELPTAFTGRVTPYTYERVKVGDGITDVKYLPFLADDSLATDLTGHADNTVIHITSPERIDWNAAKVHADSEHAPIEAQENLIEVITVNGNVQSIEGKTVNLTVPATPDEIGAAPSLHNHDDAYDKKGASTEALTSAQAYTDSVTATIKNDLTDELQEAVEEESIRAQSIENLIKVMLADKVDKVAGKVLSSNDFTIEEKLKLASLTAFSIDNELSDTSENTVQNRVITQALLTKQDKILGGIRQIVGFDVSGNLVARDFASLDEALGVNEVNEICGLLAYITRPNEWGTTVIAKRFKYSENDYGTTVII
jgi:hypothetical protein